MGMDQAACYHKPKNFRIFYLPHIITFHILLFVLIFCVENFLAAFDVGLAVARILNCAFQWLGLMFNRVETCSLIGMGQRYTFLRC